MDLSWKRLTRLFSSSAAPTLPAPDYTGSSQKQLESALAQMAVARHGDRCQTLTFQTIAGTTEWRTAQQDPFTGKWAVRKHTEQPNISGSAAAVGEPTIKTMTLHEGITFFEAVTILSDYERGQIGLGVLPINDAADMDHRHVIAFAEREGVAFDVNGKPHPTLNGEVVTDGTFTKSALENARAFSKHQSAFYKTGGNDVLSQLIATNYRADDVFDDIMEKSDAYALLKMFIGNIQDVKDLLVLALEKNHRLLTKDGFILDVKNSVFEDIQKNTTHHNREISKTAKLVSDIYSVIKRASLTTKLTPQDVFKSLIDDTKIYAIKIDKHFGNDFFYKSASAIELFLELTIARHRSAPDNALQANYRSDVITIKDKAPSFESRFLELGGSEDELWRVKSTIVDPDAPSIGQALAPFMKQMETLQKDIEAGLPTLKRVVHAGPVANIGTGPR